MSALDVTIVDTGGNVGSVVRAFSYLGARTQVSRDAEHIARSRLLVLPGVGAFAPPREVLRGALEEALQAALHQGAWLFGICVGFQLLFEASTEFGEHDGLGLLPGRITRLPSTVQLPHIGWNRLHDVLEHPLLDDLGREEAAHLYFVHSFAPESVPPEVCLAQATHGRPFAAVAGRERVLGAQFHPEKSGRLGLKVLANFLRLEGVRGYSAGA